MSLIPLMIPPELEHLAVDIKALNPDPENTRRHPDRSIQVLKQSLREFGQVVPVVATANGTVLAGNGLLRAALELGWSEIAVSWFEGGPRAARAYGIADNKTAELSRWDEGVTRERLTELACLDENFAAEFAFQEEDLAKMFAREDPKWKTTGSAHAASGADTRYLVNMVFETDREKSVVQAWLRLLRKEHPTCATPGDRLVAHIRQSKAVRIA